MSRRTWCAAVALALAALDAYADPPNLTGSVWMGVAPVPSGVEFRFSAGASKLTPENTFGAHAVLLSHDYFRLDSAQVADLVAGLQAWLAAPHSNTIFRSPSEGVGLSVTGSASDPTKVPVAVLQVYWWTSAGPGHHHGGAYVALVRADAADLAGRLAAWLSSDVASEALIYTKAIQ
jgi:hypothetical protein